MWILGLWSGAKWAKDNLPIENWADRLWIPAAFIAAALLFVRYAEINDLNLSPYSLVFDKWHLGVLRLIDFAAITLVLVHFNSLLKPLAIRPLVLLGQASLQVFVTHFVLCFIGLGLMGSDPRLYGPIQFVLIAVTFATLLLVAKFFAKPDSPSTPHPKPIPQPS
jgi:hypothetical protein